MKKVEYIEAKEMEKDAKKKLDEAAKTLKDFKEPIEKKKLVKAQLDTDCKEASNLVKENSRLRIELLEKENHLGVLVQGKYKEMENLRKQEDSRQQRILKAKDDLAAAESELQNLPICEPPTGVLEKLGSQISELEVSANQKKIQKLEQEKLLNQRKHALRQCVERLKSMESKNNKLLHALKNSGTEKISEAYYWVQEHKHEFNKEVYGPVLLEVNVSNQRHADFLEGQVAYYIWKAFITQDSHDRDLLAKNLKLFGVPILNYVSGEDRRKKKSFEITKEMHELGIYSRLDQVFDAPDAVKEVMSSQSGLDFSYIGSKETDQKADEVAKLDILDFWTPENHYHWSVSRYGGHVSASVVPVVRSRLLMCSSDAGEIETLRCRIGELEESASTLEESLRLLQTEQRNLEDEGAKLQKEREDIINNVQSEKRKRRELVNRIDQRKRKLALMEKEDDLDTSMAKLNDEAAKLNIQRFQCAVDVKNLLVEAVSYKWNFAEKHMASIEFDAKIKELEGILKEHQKFAQEASLHFEYCKKTTEGCREQLAAAKKDAESVAIITPQLEKEFLEMPTTIEELEAAIQDNLSQANSILCLNQNVLIEYEGRQKQIEALTKALEEDKKELTRCLADIDALKQSWLPTLRSLVAKINETYSRNFQEMAVAGEVSLDEHEKDFAQFGILIKVKFRQAGQLQVLSAHHQSGGERSVSTILYLVSLQDLANCPFRVVDEINQGMDRVNERKMFQQLVRAASQPNTPQCFLLTPKLLPNLDYSEAVSILNIVNGPWIEQAAEVWSCGESWGTVVGLVGGDLH